MNTDLPSVRTRFGLFGSIPSAMYATRTPAPVMPSERAVFCAGLDEAVWVVSNASGLSCGLPAWQLPGNVFRPPAADALAKSVRAGRERWITASDVTAATPGLARSRAISPSDTVAANALTSRNGFTRCAFTCRSSLMMPA